MKLNAYISFNGNCREALEFYAGALGGKVISMIPYSEMPAGAGMPISPELSDKIMHGRVEVDGDWIMASDAPPERYRAPQGIQMSASINDVAQAEAAYAKLSAGGTIVMPMTETFWAQRFAMFQDKFGISWMINCEKPRP
jgi:PhnB protein